MKENLLIDNWLHSKLSYKTFYHLEEAIVIEYEYRKIAGPRSIYAYVQFECLPADELEFESTADWGKDLSPNYIKAMERAICVGIVDGLFNSDYVYRGCSLYLRNVKWNEVDSSEFAFQRTTRIAMEELIKAGKWKFKSKVL